MTLVILRHRRGRAAGQRHRRRVRHAGHRRGGTRRPGPSARWPAPSPEAPPPRTHTPAPQRGGRRPHLRRRRRAPIPTVRKETRTGTDERRRPSDLRRRPRARRRRLLALRRPARRRPPRGGPAPRAERLRAKQAELVDHASDALSAAYDRSRPGRTRPAPRAPAAARDPKFRVGPRETPGAYRDALAPLTAGKDRGATEDSAPDNVHHRRWPWQRHRQRAA